MSASCKHLQYPSCCSSVVLVLLGMLLSALSSLVLATLEPLVLLPRIVMLLSVVLPVAMLTLVVFPVPLAQLSLTLLSLAVLLLAVAVLSLVLLTLLVLTFGVIDGGITVGAEEGTRSSAVGNLTTRTRTGAGAPSLASLWKVTAKHACTLRMWLCMK